MNPQWPNPNFTKVLVKSFGIFQNFLLKVWLNARQAKLLNGEITEFKTKKFGNSKVKKLCFLLKCRKLRKAF